MTQSEIEPYILTKEEEFEVIEHEVKRLESHYKWKMITRNINSDFEIMSKMDRFDVSDKIDVVEILERANSNRVYEEWQNKKRIEEKLEQERKLQELKSFWSANTFLKFMRWTSETELGKQFIINNRTTPLIKALCFFLSEDPRFETELNYSLSKGLLIRGVSGLGKTYVVKCVEKNELKPIQSISMIEIADQLKADGSYSLNMEGKKILCLDDVGTEETPIKHYGNSINWFKDFLELYYSKQRPFNNLIVTTNLNFRQIDEKYSYRVRSRMKDMFNVIDVIGEDMRGCTTEEIKTFHP